MKMMLSNFYSRRGFDKFWKRAEVFSKTQYHTYLFYGIKTNKILLLVVSIPVGIMK